MNSHLHLASTIHARCAELDRRAALKLFVSGAALALTSCGRPDEQIVPYVQIPEREIPGIPLRFATAMPLAGYGRGVIVTSVEGRPIKIEGNLRHPASLGATDVFAEAAVLSLYDPDRSKAPFSSGASSPGALSRARCTRDCNGSMQTRARTRAADRPGDIADTDRADRRADQRAAAGEMVSLRARRGRCRACRCSTSVRPTSDAAAAFCGRAGRPRP